MITRNDPKLNADVLLMVMGFLEDHRSVLSLMTTCRFLYQKGMPSLLALPISLTFGDEMNAFCAFVQVDPLVRPRFLRDITLDSVNVNIPSWKTFLDILRRAQSLRRVSIMCDHDQKEADVFDALADITTIKNLAIQLPGPEALKILRRWKSSISSIWIIFDNTKADGEHRDPAWLLAPFSASLREIRVSDPCFRAQQSPLPLVTRTRLRLSVPYSIHPVAQAFPNLRELTVHVPVQASFLEQERQRNNQSIGQHWELLEYLEGDVMTIYGCALRCKVRYLMLTLPDILKADVLSAVLDVAQPTRLDLQLRHRENLKDLPQTLKSVSACLRHLSISFEERRGDVDLAPIIEDILTVCPSLSCLTELLLVVKKRSFHTSSIPKITVAIPVAIPNASMDVEALADRISDAVPSLQKLSLEIADDPCREWLLTSDDEGRRIPRLVSTGI